MWSPDYDLSIVGAMVSCNWHHKESHVHLGYGPAILSFNAAHVANMVEMKVQGVGL